MKVEGTPSNSIFKLRWAGEASTPSLRGDIAHLGAFKLSQAHLNSFRLIQAHSSSFKFIQTHFSSCITDKNLIQIEPYLEYAYLCRGRKLRLINLKVLLRELGFHPPNSDEAYCCIIAIAKNQDHVSVYICPSLICPHSSKFVYTRLVTRLHSSTFVYDSSTFVYIRLSLVYTRVHSSSDTSVFKIDQ